MLYIPLPTPDERAEIVAALIRFKPLAEGVDIQGVARTYCHGFSGADLSALVREAATNALRVSVILGKHLSLQELAAIDYKSLVQA